MEPIAAKKIPFSNPNISCVFAKKREVKLQDSELIFFDQDFEHIFWKEKELGVSVEYPNSKSKIKLGDVGNEINKFEKKKSYELSYLLEDVFSSSASSRSTSNISINEQSGQHKINNWKHLSPDELHKQRQHLNQNWLELSDHLNYCQVKHLNPNHSFLKVQPITSFIQSHRGKQKESIPEPNISADQDFLLQKINKFLRVQKDYLRELVKQEFQSISLENQEIKYKINDLEEENNDLHYQISKYQHELKKITSYQQEISQLNLYIKQKQEEIFDLQQQVSTKEIEIEQKVHKFQEVLEAELQQEKSVITAIYKEEFATIKLQLQNTIFKEAQDQYQEEIENLHHFYLSELQRQMQQNKAVSLQNEALCLQNEALCLQNERVASNIQEISSILKEYEDINQMSKILSKKQREEQRFFEDKFKQLQRWCDELKVKLTESKSSNVLTDSRKEVLSTKIQSKLTSINSRNERESKVHVRSARYRQNQQKESQQNQPFNQIGETIKSKKYEVQSQVQASSIFGFRNQQIKLKFKQNQIPFQPNDLQRKSVSPASIEKDQHHKDNKLLRISHRIKVLTADIYNEIYEKNHS